jgi:hypothetical protein
VARDDTEEDTMRTRAPLATVVATVMLALAVLPARGQNVPDADKGTFLLTIFLRHDQSKTLDQINEHLDRTGWRDKFPPRGVEVVSWYIMMGIGQVVTLRVPAEQLRAVNRAVEQNAWGAYRTDFYPTYDYKPIWEAQRKKP